MKIVIFLIGLFISPGLMAQCPYTGNIFTSCSGYPDTLYGYTGFNFNYNVTSFNSPPDYNGLATAFVIASPSMVQYDLTTQYISLPSNQSTFYGTIYFPSTYLDYGYYDTSTKILYLKVYVRFIDDPSCNSPYMFIEPSPQGMSFVWIKYPPYNISTSASICENDTFYFGTQTLTSAGTYTEVFQAQNGADSTVVLTLNINPGDTSFIDTTIFAGNSVLINSQLFSEQGEYVVHLSNMYGCDSVIYLNLNVLVPFIDTSKVWSILSESYYPYINTSSYYRLSGDTIINSKIYTRVLRCDEEELINWYTCGYIRGNEFNKIFFLDTSNVENLLYDFNANINDTINSDLFPALIVRQIDTVFFAGELRKRLLLTYDTFELDTNYCEKWYEGIGSLCGLLHSGTYGLVGGITKLLCYSESNTLLYIQPGYTECFIVTNIDINTHKSRLNFYPNPATDDLFIEFSNLQPQASIFQKYRIYGLEGKKVKEGNLEGTKTRISTKDLENGVYFIEVGNNRSKFIIVR